MSQVNDNSHRFLGCVAMRCVLLYVCCAGSTAVASGQGDAVAAHAGQAAAGSPPGAPRNRQTEAAGWLGTAQDLGTQQRQKGAEKGLSSKPLLHVKMRPGTLITSLVYCARHHHCYLVVHCVMSSFPPFRSRALLVHMPLVSPAGVGAHAADCACS